MLSIWSGPKFCRVGNGQVFIHLFHSHSVVAEVEQKK